LLVKNSRALEPGLPLLDLALGFVALNAVAFLHATDQLLALALHLVEVIIGELAPLFAGLALELLRSDPSS
jgi:hypothetical protein